MEHNTRKRKRESLDTIITYLAPGRTFERLLKENSLQETKQVVRRKLNLSDDVSICLAQQRGERVIDLEDDDDFDAFCVAARMSGSVDVRVTVLSDTNSAIPTPSDSHSLSPNLDSAFSTTSGETNDINAPQKRKVAFEGIPSSPSESQVIPPRKRRRSVSAAAPSMDKVTVSTSDPTFVLQLSDEQSDSTASTSVPSTSDSRLNATSFIPTSVTPSFTGQTEREQQMNVSLPAAGVIGLVIHPQHRTNQTGIESPVSPQAENPPEKLKIKKAKGRKLLEAETGVEDGRSNETSNEKSTSKKSTEQRFPEQLAETMNAATTTDDPREQQTGASSDRRPRRKSVTLSVEVPPVKNISDSSKTAASKITTERTEAEDSGKTKRKKKKKSVAPVDNAATEDVTEETASKNRDDREPIKRKKVDKNKKSARASSEDKLEAARASLSSIVHLRSVPAAQKGSVSKPVQKKTKPASVVVSHGDDDHLLSSESSDSVHLGKAALTVRPNTSLGSTTAGNSIPDSPSESSDEEPIIYPPPSLPEKPLSIAFPDIDLEALMRGPKTRRLTLDNALFSNIPAAATDAILEDDADDTQNKKLHVVRQADWSDSEMDDENDSGSENVPGLNTKNTSPEPLDNVHSIATSQAQITIPSPTQQPPAKARVKSPLPPPASGSQIADPIQPTIVSPRAESPIEVDDQSATARPSWSRDGDLSSSLAKPSQTPARATNTQPLSIHEQGIRESVVKMTRVTRSRSKQLVSSQSTTTNGQKVNATAEHPMVTPVQMMKSTNTASVTPAPWTTLDHEPSSPSQGDATSVGGVDELRSSSLPGEDVEEATESYSQPLFIASESQTRFPYSQWKDVDDDPAADSDDEQEVEAAVGIQSRTASSASYRRLTDIASQHTNTLFVAPLSQFIEPITPLKPHTDMYGLAVSAYGEDSDSDSDSDVEKSHIPKSRRAGVKSR